MRKITGWSLLPFVWCAPGIGMATDGVLVVDHKGGTATLDGKTHKSGDEVRIRGGRVKIRVENTNTALYAYSLKGEKVAAPEIETLNSFFENLKPYSLELGKEALSKKPESAAEGKARELITAIDGQVNGKEGVRNTALAAISILEDVNRGVLTVEKGSENACEALLSRFEGGSNCPPGTGAESAEHLKAVGELTRKLRSLSENAAELHAQSPEPPAQLLKAVDGLLEDAEKITAAAYHAQALAVAVIHARSVWESEDQEITWDEGKSLTLTIAAKKTPELARLARLGDLQLKITVLADWLVRPAVGLSFLYSPNSSFPTYAAAGKDADLHVRAAGTNDQRFQWGLALSMTWRGLDWRKGSGWAVWFPELTVNPSSDVKAVAVGAGVSWKFVKLGGGVMWTRHAALDGLRAGDPLTTKDDLRTTDAYGRPNGYVSLSLVGWQPFVPDKP